MQTAKLQISNSLGLAVVFSVDILLQLGQLHIQQDSWTWPSREDTHTVRRETGVDYARRQQDYCSSQRQEQDPTQKEMVSGWFNSCGIIYVYVEVDLTDDLLKSNSKN